MSFSFSLMLYVLSEEAANINFESLPDQGLTTALETSKLTTYGLNLQW